MRVVACMPQNKDFWRKRKRTFLPVWIENKTLRLIFFEASFLVALTSRDGVLNHRIQGLLTPSH
jgi:hypothetical protein